MLKVEGLQASYGSRVVLQNVSFSVAQGEVVAIFGRNGAGRSTLLKAIAGQLPIDNGRIEITGQDATHWPAFQRARAGLSWVPEDKALFGGLSVENNLLLGCGPAMAPQAKRVALFDVYEEFPILAERASVAAGTLSGGEQQLLAFARTWIRKPALWLLDEPAEGLAPRMVEKISQVLLKCKAQGSAILLVEQKLHLSLDVADRCIVLGGGHVVFSSSVQALRADRAIWQNWLSA